MAEVGRWPTVTCHSRWCPFYIPEFESYKTGFLNDEFCKNIDSSAFKKEYFNTPDNEPYASCCKLFCGEPSGQLLQLQCQAMSESMAIVFWIVMVFLVGAASIQLISIAVGRGSRKVDMLAGPLFLTFIALVVYLVGDRFGEHFDTPFYPIVGAMNVAAFSYYFSSFKYSIGLAYELASAVALVGTMIPVWRILTRTAILPSPQDSVIDEFDTPKIRTSFQLVTFMLVLSVLWVVHSCLYRTITYRTTWNTELKKLKKHRNRPEGKNFDMNELWVLAGAQGHPTWRTHTGQSLGLYLLVLSWFLTHSIHIQSQEGCKEDLVLFHFLLWVPAPFLTMAVLFTQISIFCRNFLNSKGHKRFRWNIISPLFGCSRRQGVLAQYYDALISYRLGRDTLEVEEGINKYKLLYCSVDFDRFLAGLVVCLEVIIFPALALLGNLLLELFQWVLFCIFKCTSSVSQSASQSVRQSVSQESQEFKSCCGLLRMLQPNQAEKMRAYKTLCECCLDEGTSKYYSEASKLAQGIFHCEGVTVAEIDAEVCNILRGHRRNIRLSLLLDNMHPPGFAYLLQQLVYVLNEPSEELVPALNERSEQLVTDLNERSEQLVSAVLKEPSAQSVTVLNEQREQLVTVLNVQSQELVALLNVPSEANGTTEDQVSEMAQNLSNSNTASSPTTPVVEIQKVG